MGCTKGSGFCLPHSTEQQQQETSDGPRWKHTFKHSWLSPCSVCVGHTIWEAEARESAVRSFSFQIMKRLPCSWKRKMCAWQKMSPPGYRPVIPLLYHVASPCHTSAGTVSILEHPTSSQTPLASLSRLSLSHPAKREKMGMHCNCLLRETKRLLLNFKFNTY